MLFQRYFSGIAACCGFLIVCACGEKQKSRPVHFTKVDSLTETYLEIKDTMLQTWNAMINDDNQKIKAMHHLLHELEVSNPSQRENYRSLEERLERLMETRYTQKSMANSLLVEEYDFASNSLVSELISEAESQAQFAYNTTLQKLVDKIRTADQRVNNYRQEYDAIATRYNAFIDRNSAWMDEIDADSFVEKKPLFRMVADDN